jgi:hypothetical protein
VHKVGDEQPNARQGWRFKTSRMDVFDESRELKTSLSHAHTQPGATTAERGRKSYRERNGEEVKEFERKIRLGPPIDDCNPRKDCEARPQDRDPVSIVPYATD